MAAWSHRVNKEKTEFFNHVAMTKLVNVFDCESPCRRAASQLLNGTVRCPMHDSVQSEDFE